MAGYHAEGPADTEAKLTFLRQQVGGVAAVVEQARDEAARARGRQLPRSKMFRALELRARRALGSISKEDVSSPLETHDGSYLDFFSKLVERLEVGAKKVGGIIEEESRDLLTQAATRIFSHLLNADPNFDFGKVIAPVPEEVRDTLGKAVEDHVDALHEHFAPGESSSGVEGGDDDGGSGGDGDMSS